MFFCVTTGRYQGRQICVLVSLRAEVSAEREGFGERRAFHFCFPNEHQALSQGQRTLISQDRTPNSEQWAHTPALRERRGKKIEREVTACPCFVSWQNADIMLTLTADEWNRILISAYKEHISNWLYGVVACAIGQTRQCRWEGELWAKITY